MEALIQLASDLLVNTFFQKFQTGVVNFFTSLISVVTQGVLNLFNTPILLDFVEMGILVGRLVFGATFLILLIDLLEEAGSWKSEQAKAIEWTTIFFNLIKAVVFMEFAPKAGIVCFRLIVESVSTFDPTPYLNGMLTSIPSMLIGALVGIVAVGGFAIVSVMRFGAILVQSFTVFLYVPDVVRGHTTAMGSWIRQTVANLLTFFLQYVMFFMGLTLCVDGQFVPACALWIVMCMLSKYLDKYGMSTGVTGAISTASHTAQSACHAISAMIG